MKLESLVIANSLIERCLLVFLLNCVIVVVGVVGNTGTPLEPRNDLKNEIIKLKSHFINYHKNQLTSITSI